MVTKNPEVSTVEKDATSKKQRGRPSSEAPTFPRDSLSKILKIAESIEKNNAGKPYDRLDLAKSIDMSPASSSFRQMITSSTRHGLTDGSYNSDKITLTTLGSSIVAPTSDEQKANGLRNALLNPELFKNVFNYFDKKQIPREELFKNTLKKEFNVQPQDVDSCYEVITQNMKDYGLVQDIKGNTYLQLDKLGSVTMQVLSHESAEDVVAEQETVDQTIEIPREEIAVTKAIPRVFISHSKNKNILQQIKDMLEFGNFEYKIAEEVETAAIPIPEKVFGLMRECNCAIINISADDEMKQEDGSYRINENVLIEIGGAFIHYDKKVILLVDKRLTLPSNLQGLYRCEYEGDELSWNIAMRLQKALSEFKEKI